MGLIEEITDSVKNITVEELEKSLKEDLVDKNQILTQLKVKIPQFLQKFKNFQSDYLLKHKKSELSISAQCSLLKAEIDIIYKDFFEIQNLLNAYINQKIIMTYVDVDGEGNRSIKVSNNNSDILNVEIGNRYGHDFTKLGYNFVDEQHYSLLKNALPEKDNKTLNETAKEVERRYSTYKKKVLWYYPDTWKGYKFNSKGPINEAYVNFYVHDVKLNKSIEGNIDDFILDNTYGAKLVDSTKGFMIGDVSKNGIQYAVKGAFGSPQHYKEVVNTFNKLLNGEELSEKHLQQIINKYVTEEGNRELPSHISELSKKSISQIVARNKDLKEIANML